MNSAPILSEKVTLTGERIELVPLEAQHAPLLVRAAEDGELWNMKVTVIPGPATAQHYVARFWRMH